MNFKRMKLKKSLIIGFAMAMVPLVLIIVFCLFNQRSMQSQFNSLIQVEVQIGRASCRERVSHQV